MQVKLAITLQFCLYVCMYVCMYHDVMDLHVMDRHDNLLLGLMILTNYHVEL